MEPGGATLLPELERVAVFPYSILFIRHGETSYNAEGRLQGQRDIPLNGKGREQASAVGRTLKKLFPLPPEHSEPNEMHILLQKIQGKLKKHF